MLKTQNKDSNYLAKVVALKRLRKHGNADRLQCVNVGMNNVITGMTAKEGDLYVFFPIESKISRDFLSFTNSFRDTTMNADMNEKGFFNNNCRVRAMKLRGEKSMGYLVPAEQVANWKRIELSNFKDGLEFDTVAGDLLVEKYEVKRKERGTTSKGQSPRLDRLVDGQVNLHVKTKNLRHVPDAIQPDDLISITYKTHGTSWWCGNLLTKTKISRFKRLLNKFGANIPEVAYDIIYGSRRVVKNRHFSDPKAQDHFYGYDMWHDVAERVKNTIPKGVTLYGELLGFTRDGGYIQKGFDYGCSPQQGYPSDKIEVYRITHTDEDGNVTEYSYPQIVDFCNQRGLVPSKLMFYGTAKQWYDLNADHNMRNPENWGEEFVSLLERVYNEKDCFMCNNPVPEEGIVIRKEDLFDCKVFKLKSFRFLEWETKQLDKGESDVESEN